MTQPDPIVTPSTDPVVALPDGFVPGTVAPFVMRYGVDFLVAMRRVALDAAAPVADTEQARETA